MSSSNPDSLRCQKEFESQRASNIDLQAPESPEMDITTTSETAAPCVGSEPNKDTQSHVVATSTANKHAVPWPHVEPWRRNVALAGYVPHTRITQIFFNANLISQYLCRGILLDSGHDYHRDGVGQHRRGTRELLAIAMDRPGLSPDIYE
jgi:hypothetical protein